MVAGLNVTVKAANGQSDDKTGTSNIRLTLEVRSREQVDKVIAALRRKADVMDVYRVTG